MVVASTSTVMTTSTTPMWPAVVTLSRLPPFLPRPLWSKLLERLRRGGERDRGWRNTVAASFANGLAQADGIRHFDEVEARMVCQLGL